MSSQRINKENARFKRAPKKGSEIKRFSGRTCQITGKRAMFGNRVSHANNKTRHKFDANIQTKRFWSEKEQRFIRIKVSTYAIRLIDKFGLDHVLECIYN